MPRRVQCLPRLAACSRRCGSAASASSTTPSWSWARPHRRHRRDRRGQDDGGDRPRACCSAPGRRRARCGPAPAARWSRAGSGSTRRRRSPCGARGRRRRARRGRPLLAGPHGHGRGALAGARRRPRRAGRRAGRARRPSWWPCTASPTRSGCCARPGSASCSTGTPAPGSPTPLGARTPGATTGCARSRPSWPSVAHARPRAGPGGRPAAARPGGDRARSTRSPARTTTLAAEAQRLAHADACAPAAELAHAGCSSGDGRPAPTGAGRGRRWSRRRPATLEAAAGARPGAGASCAARLGEVGHPGRRPGGRAGVVRRRVEADPARLAAPRSGWRRCAG